MSSQTEEAVEGGAFPFFVPVCVPFQNNRILDNILLCKLSQGGLPSYSHKSPLCVQALTSLHAKSSADRGQR